MRVDLGLEDAPYSTSTAVERLPKVLAYPPSLTFRKMSLEDYHVMVFNLALARPFNSYRTQSRILELGEKNSCAAEKFLAE